MVMVGLACLVLGMGMNTVAAFILVSVVGVPALTSHGVDVFVANMFVFYFALLSHITPPVCLAIFAGAQVAGANIWETAFVGVKMAVVAYLLPFLIVAEPGLLLLETPLGIIIGTLGVAVGSLFLIAAIQGWVLTQMTWLERLLSAAAGGCIIWPDLSVQAIGVVLAVVTGGVAMLRYRGSGRDQTT